MKKILKVVSGFAAVVALSCLLAAPAQARTFVSVNVGGYGGYGYGYSSRYAAPCYPAGYCYRAPVCYRPAFGCYFPRFIHFGGFWR